MNVDVEMEAIRQLGPSWKTDVVLTCTCNGQWRRWSAEARDVWGHMHTPVFYASSAERALAGVREFMEQKMLSESLAGVAYVDDDGNCTDCEYEYYLDREPKAAGVQ